jgi:8-oxo-dGTP pyrophosphatase MutT (NUDIX family)
MEPRDAATVMLVRDASAGLEVFMLMRNLESAPWGGLHLFPGGAVDEDDRHADLETVCRGRSDDQASAILGVDSGGLAFWVAAVRECFEEAGVLLVDGLRSDIDLEAYREPIESGELKLIDLCRKEGLMITADTIHYVSHWITPEGAPRRYDTRFFVAAAPPDQVPLHDDREAIAHLWAHPLEALARQEAGELDMLPPTISNLRWLGRYDSVEAVMAGAAWSG